MGLLNKKENTRLEKIYNYLKNTFTYEYKKDALEYLDKKQKNIKIFDDELLADILTIIIDNNLHFNEAIKDAEQIYNSISINKNDENQRTIFLNFFRYYNVYSKAYLNDFISVYFFFEDKSLFLGIMDTLDDYLVNSLPSNFIDFIIKYIKETRKYYVDERAFCSSCFHVLNEIMNHKYNYDEIKKIIESEIEQSKKIAGIYDIDENKLETIPKEINELEKRQLQVSVEIQKCAELVEEILNKMENKKEDILLDLDRYKKEIEKLSKNIKQETIVDDGSTKILLDRFDTLIEKIVDLKSQQLSSNEVDKCNSEVLEKEQSSVANPLILNNLDENNILNLWVANILSKIKRHIKLKDYDLDEEKTKIIDERIKKELMKLSFVNNKIIDKNDNIIESIANLDIEGDFIDFLIFYYFSIYNDNEKLYKEFLSKITTRHLELYYLDKDISSIFEHDQYINLVINNQKLFNYFYCYKKLELLKQLLTINPDYVMENKWIDSHSNCYLSDDKFDKIIEVFGVEYIANNFSKLEKNIENTKIEHIDILKQLMDINPDIIIRDDNDYIFIEKGVLSLNEFSKLTVDDLKKISSIFRRITDENKNEIRRLIFRCISSNVVLNYGTLELLNSDFISEDEYFNLDLDTSYHMCDTYNDYIRYRINHYYKRSTQALKELKEIIKKTRKEQKTKVKSSGMAV